MDEVIKYIKVDLYRCFLSRRFAIAVIIILGILLLGLQEAEQGYFEADVYSYFLFTMEMTPHILIFSGAAFAYAGSFCEDREHWYIRNEVMRGNKKSFVAARIVTVFLSAQVAVMLGSTIFAYILHFFYPWAKANTTGMYECVVEMGIFRGLPIRGYHFLYFVLWGLVYGVLAGILSVVSTWISLYISSRALMLISPVVIFYFLDQWGGKLFPETTYGLNILFSCDYCWTQNTGKAVIVLIMIALLAMLLFGCLIYSKLKKEA